jgi:hypothetical protein
VAAVDLVYKRYEYLDADSDDALLDSIDPSLIQLGKQLDAAQQRFTPQLDTV